jgi:hypothetical protein
MIEIVYRLLPITITEPDPLSYGFAAANTTCSTTTLITVNI